MRFLILFSCLLILICSCQNSSNSTLEEATLKGNYNATRLYVVDTLLDVDREMIAAGAEFSVNFIDDSLYSCHFFLPDSLAKLYAEPDEYVPGMTIEMNIQGTYTKTGEHIQFYHTEDFFLKDLKQWKVDGNTISCQDTLGRIDTMYIGGNPVELILPVTIYDIKLEK